MHEGPAAFSRAAKPVPLAPGMILSDEPGYYLPGQYGIRIENLLLVREAEPRPDQVKPFLEFETLTLAPYDRALVDTGAALARPSLPGWMPTRPGCWPRSAPHCDAATAAWLRAACAPLNCHSN